MKDGHRKHGPKPLPNCDEKAGGIVLFLACQVYGECGMGPSLHAMDRIREYDIDSPIRLEYPSL
jgi:hypothetical protein